MKARQKTEVVPLSFRETSAWISLVTMLGIFGFYFWSVIHSGQPSGGSLLGTIIVLVVVQTALTVAVASFTRKEAKAPRDERDRLIELKAARFAYAVLAGSIACVCFFGGFQPPIIFNANALLFVLVVAEILRSACQVVQYRRGA